MVLLVAVLLSWVSVGNAADPASGPRPEIVMPDPSSLVAPAGVPVPGGAPESPARKRFRGKRLSAVERAELRRERLRSRGLFRGLDRAGALAAFRAEHRSVVSERGFSPLAGLRVDRIRSKNAAVVVSPRSGERRPSLVVSSAPLATEDASGTLVPVDKSLVETGGTFRPRVTGDALLIGDSAGDAVQVGDQGDVAVRALGVADSPAVLERDTVVYPNVMRDTDLAVRPAPEGVETFHHLRSPESPETVSLSVSLPDGAVLDGDGEKGWQIVRGEAVLGAISAPVAFDANLEPLDVETKVNGALLEMTVRHRDREVQYPIVVDPVIQRSSHNTQIWPWNHDLHGWRPASYAPGFEHWALNHPGWPRTLLVASHPGMHNAGANAQWIYDAGGATARIWWAKFYGWNVPAPYSNPDTYAFTGMWSAATGNWEVSNYGSTQLWMQGGAFSEWNPTYCPLPAAQPTWTNPDPGCIDWGGSYNNVAALGVYMGSSAVRGQYNVSFIRGFGVAIADWHPPSVSATNLTSWIADGQASVTASDTGLGIGTVRVEAPNQPDWNGAFYEELVSHADPAPAGKCDASTYKPCPRTKTYPLRLGNLPKGRNHTLWIWVTDAVGNVLGRTSTIVGVAAPATDRALYREAGSPNVWMMFKGHRHWVASPDAAQAAGLNLANLVDVPAGNLASYPRGSDINAQTASQWRYSTSVTYGGDNQTVDTEAEADAVGQALANSANTPALWAGLSPGDQLFVMDIQTPTFAVWGPRVDTLGPAALSGVTIDEANFGTRTAEVSWEIGEDPDLSPDVPGSGTATSSYRWRESDGTWRAWVNSEEFGFTLDNADPNDTFLVEIREKDAAGNWGPTNAVTLQAPATSSEPRLIPAGLFLACVQWCPLAAGATTGATVLARGTTIQVTRVTLKTLTVTPARSKSAAAAWRGMTTRNTAHRRLRRNMIDARMGPGGGRQAHHIVPISRRWSGRAQEIMRKCNIGPDDAANGVYLTRYQHRKTFTKAYAENLNRILEHFEATCIGQPLGPFANVELKKALREVGDSLADSALRMGS